MEQRTKGTLLALSGMALMSLDAVFVRLSGLGGWTSSFLFGFFSFFSMVALTIATSKDGLFGSIRKGGVVLILSGVVMGGSGTSFVLAVDNTTVANVILIMSSTPLFSAFFSRILIGEKTDGRTWAVIAVTIFGIYIIVRGSISTAGASGDFLAISATAFSSLNYVIWRKYPHISRTMAVGFGGFFIALFSSFGAELDRITPFGLGVMVVMGLFTAPFGRTFVSTATRYIKATEISIYTLPRTILTPLIIWLIFNEIPKNSTFVGGAVLLVTIAWHICTNKR